MKKSNKKLIIISFILALIAAIAIFSYLNSLKKTDNQADKIKILVANDTIPASTLIDKKMIKEIQVPNDSIFKYYIKDYSKLVGKYTKDTVMKNEGFNSENIIGKNGNDISVKLDKGFRAVSINVTGASAVSDLIKAGDNVDIAAYMPEKTEQTKIVRPDTTKIILQNIKVLAVDKNINRDDTKSTSSSDTKDKIPTTFLVTLSVSLSDIEKLFLAEETGTLKLALRPIGKEDNSDTSGTVWQDILNGSLKGSSDAKTDTSHNKSSNSENTQRIVNYTVMKDDTLKLIAQAFYGDSEKYTLIKNENNITNENQIMTGQVIKVPIR